MLIAFKAVVMLEACVCHQSRSTLCAHVTVVLTSMLYLWPNSQVYILVDTLMILEGITNQGRNTYRLS